MKKNTKKLTKKEIARLAKTAPEYLSSCSTGNVTPSLDFVIRVMEAVPGQLRLRDVSPVLADKIDRIRELETIG